MKRSKNEMGGGGVATFDFCTRRKFLSETFRRKQKRRQDAQVRAAEFHKQQKRKLRAERREAMKVRVRAVNVTRSFTACPMGTEGMDEFSFQARDGSHQPPEVMQVVDFTAGDPVDHRRVDLPNSGVRVTVSEGSFVNYQPNPRIGGISRGSPHGAVHLGQRRQFERRVSHRDKAHTTPMAQVRI